MHKVSAMIAALAFGVGAGNSALAVTLNPGGLGQALVFPYYTVNAQQATLLSIVNTSDVGSAARLRFNEGMDGRPVLEFTVFLSPHDVWTAAITEATEGGAQLTTSDHSCTYPTPAAAGEPFVATYYDGTGDVAADGGTTSITRTREGSIELIALGDIVPTSPLDVATTHALDGNPDAGIPSCSPEVIGHPAAADLVTPSNGLMGSAAMVNVGQGTFYAYNADALAGFTAVPLAVDASGNGPSLNEANSAASSHAAGAIANLFDVDGEPLQLDYANPIDAVSAVFSAEYFFNEYIVDASLGASTDWVVTFPTKSFYVDPQFDGTPIPPFLYRFGGDGSGSADVNIGTTSYDREEGSLLLCDGFNICAYPSPLAYQVNVRTFADPSAATAVGVLGSQLGGEVRADGANGWLRLDLANSDGGHVMRADTGNRQLLGLPATGFMVYSVINANAQPGLLANYGGLLPHRRSLFVSLTTPSG